MGKSLPRSAHQAAAEWPARVAASSGGVRPQTSPAGSSPLCPAPCPGPAAAAEVGGGDRALTRAVPSGQTPQNPLLMGSGGVCSSYTSDPALL